MRPFLFLAAVFALAPVSVAEPSAAEPQRFANGPARVSLVELYTSEGCSSCPPAERWLGALRDDAGLWKTFVPVAFHVNYWDRLGWTDRFASREATQREYAYADVWGTGSVYTPCIVRDGAEWHGAGEKISAASGAPAGTLTASYDGVVLRAKFSPVVRPANEQYEIHAALLGGGIVSKVTGGENSGETLHHEFVALALAQGEPNTEIKLAAPKAAGSRADTSAQAGVPRRALAVWVTRRGELAPLQATGGWLAP